MIHVIIYVCRTNTSHHISPSLLFTFTSPSPHNTTHIVVVDIELFTCFVAKYMSGYEYTFYSFIWMGGGTSCPAGVVWQAVGTCGRLL
jgi:hypothetical protein